MEIPGYEPFYLETLADLRAEITRLGLSIPVSDSTDSLFQPRQIAGCTVPNAFCAQPIANSPGPLSIRRYQKLADGGFSLIWVTEILGKLDLRDLRSRSEAIFISQLSPCPAAELPDSAVESQLHSLVEDARSAAEAGFDGIDISCHHGTLAAHLLAARKRPGRFGGSLENRMRFVLEAIHRIREAHPDLILAVRLNAFHASEGGFGVDAEDFRKPDPSEPIALVRALEAAGISILNPAANNPNRLAPDRQHRPLSDSENPHEHPLAALQRLIRLSEDLANAAPDLSVIAGGFGWLRDFAPHVAAALLENGRFAMAGFGRGALAFPEAPSFRQWPRGRVCLDCGACSELNRTGNSVGCPIRDPATYGPIHQGMRRTQEDTLREGLKRCHFCEAAPCVSADPLHTPIPEMITAWLEGDRETARQLLFSANPLPGIASRLSPAWMEAEGACIETALRGASVPILDLQAAIAWDALQEGNTGIKIPPHSINRTVAVLGSGPAGLGAAAFFLEHGYTVQLHEKSQILGGMPARVIPTRRAGPIDLEIQALLDTALKANRLSVFLENEILPGPSLEDLRRSVDAVLVCTGVWNEPTLGKRGNQILGGLEFLESFKNGSRSSVPGRVAVLAGSDCAMESARLARESGASEVHVVFAGERSALHWHMPESWFATPGVHALMEWEPLHYERRADGELLGLHLRHTKFQTSVLLEIDMVIEAMALQRDPRWDVPATSGIHFAGAILNGGTSVASCLAEGRAAASRFHADLFP
jgi:NADPH-dependent glutamate synthase beta subunit-like oxidoreductase/2,4-dienoyl-CoA reductase-like NADH-dependent reductase (Old Yellow Enzyme family)